MIANTISDSILFKGVDKNFVASLVESHEHVKVKKDNYLFHQNDTGHGMYIVLKGKVNIILERQKAQGVVDEKIIATIEQGNFFGEVCVIQKERRTAAAKAVEETELVYLDGEIFNAQIKENSVNALRIAYNIATILAARLKKANITLSSLLKELDQPKTEIIKFKEKLLLDVLI